MWTPTFLVFRPFYPVFDENLARNLTERELVLYVMLDLAKDKITNQNTCPYNIDYHYFISNNLVASAIKKLNLFRIGKSKR